MPEERAEDKMVDFDGMVPEADTPQNLDVDMAQVGVAGKAPD
ncbi:MAG: hypothetical protein AAGA53_11055 [Pseudomonadota bacterium]